VWDTASSLRLLWQTEAKRERPRQSHSRLLPLLLILSHFIDFFSCARHISAIFLRSHIAQWLLLCHFILLSGAHELVVTLPTPFHDFHCISCLIICRRLLVMLYIFGLAFCFSLYFFIFCWEWGHARSRSRQPQPFRMLIFVFILLQLSRSSSRPFRQRVSPPLLVSLPLHSRFHCFTAHSSSALRFDECSVSLIFLCFRHADAAYIFWCRRQQSFQSSFSFFIVFYSFRHLYDILGYFLLFRNEGCIEPKSHYISSRAD